MYIYNMYNFDYDDTSNLMLTHDKLFLKAQFRDIVRTCKSKVEQQLVENRFTILNKKKSDALSTDEWEEILKLSHIYKIFFQTYKMLIKDFGFEEPHRVFTFTFNGEFYGTGGEKNK